ncbi:MAG: hypothetical protein R6V58_06610, partial [Planctomycetota bacterium]
RLSSVRSAGDWEGWTSFFLRSVREAADDGVGAARRLFELTGEDRRALLGSAAATVQAIRLFDLLPEHPMVTVASAADLLHKSKPTASKAVKVLCQVGILQEITGKRRDRVYAYAGYLKVLAEDTELSEGGESRDEAFERALRRVNERFGEDLRRLAD